MIPDLHRVVDRFCFEGRFIDARPYGSGYINDTYAVSYGQPDGVVRRYILQRINHQIFTDPPALMQNIERVTRHLRQKIIAEGGDPERQTLNLIPTREQSRFYQDPAGNTWRAYQFIEGARAYDVATSLNHVYHAGKAFGTFQRLLADLPADQLHETIPDFHNTPKRFDAFVAAVEQDRVNRARSVREEIEAVEARAEETTVLTNLLKQGLLPLRVTHNDTKVSNVLIDDVTGEGICVIDLDTVMPGLSLYDFGDAVRAGAALAAEDEPDLSKVGFSLETFESLARGYLEAARDFLTLAELDHLAFSARVITLEQLIRFLADYINGDTYYKVSREHHNLDRARTQLKMLRDMEEQFDKMVDIVARHQQTGDQND